MLNSSDATRAAPPTERPLRIVHVVDSLEFGGLERVVVDLAIAQKHAGHQVQVFSINATAGFRPNLESADIRVVVGDKQGTLDRRVLKSLRATTAQADVVHAHNFVPNYYAALATLFQRGRRVQICTCHDMGTRLSNRRLRWLFRWSLSRTRRVAMVGQQVCDRFIEMGMVDPRRAVTVLNGIPVQRFRNSPERKERARGQLGLPATSPVIGCVGRLVGLKNHALLLTQMPRLLQTHPDLMLVIVGDGPLHDQLLDQVQSLGIARHVMLLGARTDVADLLPAFDVFALPSQTEGLSIALLEACATGLAVVASRVGGNPEIIHDGQTGRLIEANDAQSLLHGLTELLDDPVARARFGAAACDWVTAHASIDALRRAYDDCYIQALNG